MTRLDLIIIDDLEDEPMTEEKRKLLQKWYDACKVPTMGQEAEAFLQQPAIEIMSKITEPQLRPMFPNSIDSTILGTFRACPQKFFRQYVEHWKAKTNSVHLVAGGAFASGIEVARRAFFTEGKDATDAEGLGLEALIKHYGDFECPEDSAKSLERMCGALEFYFERYPLGGDGADPIELPGGKRGIEFSFAEPIDIRHPVTGDPILYTGRSDMIAHRASGIYVYDEKTTSSLGASWGKQWEMRSQFTGYGWAARQQGIKVNGMIVRGVSILKTKYDTLEVPTYRSDYEYDRWYQQMLRDVKRMVQCWEEGYWDYQLEGACNDYGGCALNKVCKTSEPEAYLPVYFAKKVWDPLARRELSVKELEESWGHVRHPSLPPAEDLMVEQGGAAGMDGSLSELGL